ncbi:MAG: hypothetical protein J6Z43_06155 [Clostridiales bacterium]|nr:hypothetical protein [Clostridiales bacterium]
MNSLSQRHHELRIAYLADKLRKIPHGFFSCISGINVVIITYDPQDRSVSNTHRKRYRTTSKRGIIWSTTINDYIAVKSEYDLLIKDWFARYTTPPRQISYPLKKRRKDLISFDFFKNSLPNQNKKENKHPIEYKGQIFRSKNEIIGCQVLEKYGYEFKTEILITDGNWIELYPDLTFYVPELEKVFVKEIDGAIDQVVYNDHSTSRTGYYLKMGFTEGKDLITVRIGDPNNVDAEQIDNLIRAAIESSIDDIII